MVYISTDVSWSSCQNSTNGSNVTSHYEHVWGWSPVAAVFGPAQEVFHSHLLFDPLIVSGSWLLLQSLSTLQSRGDVFEPWLNIGKVYIYINLDATLCLDTNQLQKTADIGTEEQIHSVLLLLFKKVQI